MPKKRNCKSGCTPTKPHMLVNHWLAALESIGYHKPTCPVMSLDVPISKAAQINAKPGDPENCVIALSIKEMPGVKTALVTGSTVHIAYDDGVTVDKYRNPRAGRDITVALDGQVGVAKPHVNMVASPVLTLIPVPNSGRPGYRDAINAARKGARPSRSKRRHRPKSPLVASLR